MIIWQGWGILVAVFFVVATLLCDWAVGAVFGANYVKLHGWPMGVALLLAAAASWQFGRHLNGRPARIVIDKETGEEVALKSGTHSLFFIPMQYWGFILAAFGLYAWVKDLLR